jgi:hypothetical protein
VPDKVVDSDDDESLAPGTGVELAASGDVPSFRPLLEAPVSVPPITGIDSVVYPARDLGRSVAFWSSLLRSEPSFQTDDYASFGVGDASIGLTRLPWVDEPVIFWAVDDIEAAHAALSGLGSQTMVEVAGGRLAPLGEGSPVEGVDPVTGVVGVPGAKLAVVRAPDGTLVALNQAVAGGWSASD